jgi:hypothetical protein
MFSMCRSSAPIPLAAKSVVQFHDGVFLTTRHPLSSRAQLVPIEGDLIGLQSFLNHVRPIAARDGPADSFVRNAGFDAGFGAENRVFEHVVRSRPDRFGLVIQPFRLPQRFPFVVYGPAYFDHVTFVFTLLYGEHVGVTSAARLCPG